MSLAARPEHAVREGQSRKFTHRRVQEHAVSTQINRLPPHPETGLVDLVALACLRNSFDKTARFPTHEQEIKFNVRSSTQVRLVNLSV